MPNTVHRNRRVKFTKGDRNYVYARDKGICQLCWKPVGITGWTIDHRKPVAHGGAHIPSNWRLACRDCNTKRGTGAHNEGRYYR